MTPGSLTVRWVDHGRPSAVELPSWDFDVPGLVITQGHDQGAPVWWVTHITTGMAVGHGFDSPEPAVAALHDIAALDIDWTQPGEALTSVLRSNRWLAVEVMNITSGYGGNRLTRDPDQDVQP